LSGEVHRLLARATLAIDGDRWHRYGQSRRQPRVASDVGGLFADLPYAAADHVVDCRRVDSRAVDERAEHMGQQVNRMHSGQTASPLAHRAADTIDDHDLVHRAAPSLCAISRAAVFGLCETLQSFDR